MIYTVLFPHIIETYPQNLQIIFRPQIQPWHPSSAYCVEAATAVLLNTPEKFWPFSKALFEKQIDFTDVNVINETRNETYSRLSKIAESVGLDRLAILAALLVGDVPRGVSYNVGNDVTVDVRRMVRANRQLGIHATPTVIFNGIVESGIDSNFTPGHWLDWLEKNITSG